MPKRYVSPEYLCTEVMGLFYPPTEQDLKKKFRELAKIHHPDNKGDEMEFIKIKDAYDVLLPLCKQISSENAQYVSDFTADGYEKSELGKGYQPPMPKCDNCDGLGYANKEVRILRELRRCKSCIFGTVEVCADCNGSGKFLQRNSRKIVDCRECKGRGWFTPKFTFTHYKSMTCPTCNGEFDKETYETKISEARCEICSGKGEIYMSNPVFHLNSMG